MAAAREALIDGDSDWRATFDPFLRQRNQEMIFSAMFPYHNSVETPMSFAFRCQASLLEESAFRLNQNASFYISEIATLVDFLNRHRDTFYHQYSTGFSHMLIEQYHRYMQGFPVVSVPRPLPAGGYQLGPPAAPTAANIAQETQLEQMARRVQQLPGLIRPPSRPPYYDHDSQDRRPPY